MKHYRVVTPITRYINKMIWNNNIYTAAKTIFCVILKISNIYQEVQSDANFMERYQSGKKHCTKSRHLTSSIYDPFIACLADCHSNNINPMIEEPKNLCFKKIKNGYKYLGCNKCNI